MIRRPVLASASFAIGAALVTAFLGFQSCSREDAEPRQIRGHTRILGGVAHAEPARNAERYCSHCHGAALAGGAALTDEGAEPSCYQCHGKNWTQDAAYAAVSGAPGDHDLAKSLPAAAGRLGAYMHKSTLFTPDGDCNACHGAANEGSGGYPGCELCHTKLWTERAP